MRTIARWKSGLLPLEVFAMRVNWDTQRTSPCISLTFAFHMSPEGLENTFRDNLHEVEFSGISSRAFSNRSEVTSHFLCEILDVGGVVICAARFLIS